MDDARRGDTEDEVFTQNRTSWDQRVPVHVASEFYDVEGWLREGRGPRPQEAAALGDVSGLDLVHLQCHFGLDTLAWARLGARVTGLDFSAPAIEQACVVAQRAGLEERATFVCANVYDAVEALDHQTFDVVYVSLGALCWLPSVARWASVAAGLARPGGRLLLHDVHPLSDALSDDELVLEHTYFEEPEPYIDDSGVTYTDATYSVSMERNYSWNHSLGEIVTAVIDHGFVLEGLEEHDWTSFARFPWLVREGDQRYVLPPGRPRIPLSFSLSARRL
ncbi:MAG TPA: methyltransferase domain-containing protein [Acidimicrobiales bacterium]|nr:methyltransferase domain-containing protein [Acidimicrobiales bacterium]